MTFVLKQTVDLSQYGWDGCTVQLQALSYKEAQDLGEQYANIDPKDKKTQKETFDFIRSKFVSGTGLNEKDEKIDIKPEDLENLPITIVMGIIRALSGASVSPN